MALSRALNPSSLIGESSGKWDVVVRAGGLHTLPILRQPTAACAAVLHTRYIAQLFILELNNSLLFVLY